MPLLEIVAYSYASALAAQQGGADRIELCENTAEGGTTPGLGTIEAARELPGVKLHVMIRPRGGDFLYTDAEFKIMLRDIAVAREAGADGVVFGLLRPDATVDLERTRRLVAAAKGMSVGTAETGVARVSTTLETSITSSLWGSSTSKRCTELR